MLNGRKRFTNPVQYWARKAKFAVNEIKSDGIGDFRGKSNTIGDGYSDHLLTDTRIILSRENFPEKVLCWILRHVYPFDRAQQLQVNCTEGLSKEMMDFLGELVNLKERVKYLMSKYSVPYSILGGCARKVKVRGSWVGILYLDLLDQHDYQAKFIDFKRVRSVFEIGGGFGANIHLLLENYNNIRKVIYLDIPPNLYVGTQYLKAFFGDAVSDYRKLKDRSELRFKADDSLEILCIAPWQIELLSEEVDLFVNMHSFVEMPKEVVKNYAEKASAKSVVLVSYAEHDALTFSPDELPGFFKNRDFRQFTEEALIVSSRKNLFYVSPGQFDNP